VPYIICVERPKEAAADDAAAAPVPAADGAAAGVGCSGSLAERARHPEELRDNPSLAVDIEYYLAQQVRAADTRAAGWRMWVVASGWSWPGSITPRKQTATQGADTHSAPNLQRPHRSSDPLTPSSDPLTPRASRQVHPVVSRLVNPIEGTDAAHIADCLGLDPARCGGTLTRVLARGL
jgi:hypothetical protein